MSVFVFLLSPPRATLALGRSGASHLGEDAEMHTRARIPEKSFASGIDEVYLDSLRPEEQRS